MPAKFSITENNNNIFKTSFTKILHSTFISAKNNNHQLFMKNMLSKRFLTADKNTPLTDPLNLFTGPDTMKARRKITQKNFISILIFKKKTKG